ncbi:hypothetical protein FrEUN1fDRAFT_7925, partial [Parafrankia sp. EUN1f]
MTRRSKVVALAVVGALLVALPAILTAAKLSTPLAAACGASIAAVAAVFAGVWKDSLVALLQSESSQEISIRDGCVTINGRLPRAREITDPTLIGVHASRHATDPSGVSNLPPYIPRDIDNELRGSLAPGKFLILVGDSTAGKSRAAYEALVSTLPDHSIIAPQDRS